MPRSLTRLSLEQSKSSLFLGLLRIDGGRYDGGAGMLGTTKVSEIQQPTSNPVQAVRQHAIPPATTVEQQIVPASTATQRAGILFKGTPLAGRGQDSGMKIRDGAGSTGGAGVM